MLITTKIHQGNTHQKNRKFRTTLKIRRLKHKIPIGIQACILFDETVLGLAIGSKCGMASSTF